MSHSPRKQSARRAAFTRSAFRSLLTLGATTGVLTFATHSAVAAEKTWVGADGNFSTAASWSPTGVPGSADNADVSGGHTVTINSNQATNDLNAGGSFGGGTTGATATTGNGTYNQTAGTVVAGSNGGWFRLGITSGATGTYNLTGGSLTIASAGGQVNIGELAGGTGTFSLSTGTFTIGNATTGTTLLRVGVNGTGNLNISSGTLNYASTIGYGSIGAATGAIGIMSVTGGTYTTANALNVSDNSGSTGTLNVSGTGQVLLNAGILYVGKSSSNNATVNLGSGTTYDGSTTTATLKTSQIVGGPGTGTVNFNGGRLLENNGSTAINLLGSTAITRANVGNGGAVIDSSDTGGITVSQPLLHTNVAGQNATDGGLFKLGSGPLILTATNTYTGPTTISAGTLQIGAGGTAGTLGTNTGPITNNGVLIFNRSDTVTLATTQNITGTGALYVNNGTLVTNGASISGSTVSPSLVVDNGVAGAAVLTQSSGSISGGSGEVWFGQGTGATGTYNLSGTGSLTVNNWLAVGRGGATGIVNMSGGTITKTNSGTALTMVANSTWNQTAGALNINAGPLWIGENGAGANYNISGGTVNATVVEIGHVSGGAGTLTLQGSTGLTGALANGGGTEVFTATTFTLNTAGTGAATVNLNGGTLAINNFIQGAGTGTKTINFNGGLLRALASSATFLGGTGIIDNVQAGGALIDTNGFATTINTPLIHNGSGVDGGLTKSGTSSLTLSGTNTYTGPTVVTNGTLIAGSAGAFPSGTALTNTGATVNFNSQYLVTAGGTAALTLGGLTTTNGTFNFNFSSTQGDSVAITNAATVTGGKISINATGTSLAPGTYNLFSDAAGGLTNFTLTGTAAAGALNVNGTVYPVTLTTTDTLDTLTIGAGQLGTLYYTGSQNNNLSFLAGGLSNYSSDAAGATNAATVPTRFTDVIFTAGAANTNAANLTTDIGGNLSLNSLTFNANSTAPISITDSTNGTYTLTIYGLTGGAAGTGVSLLAGAPAVTISANVALGGSQTWTNVSSNLFTVSGTINGGGNSLTLTGSGAQTLSGAISNLSSLTTTDTGTVLLGGNDSITGSLTATAGTVTVSGNDTIGGSVNSNGSALTLSGTNSVTGAVNLTAGSLNLSGANTIGGAVTATGGTLTVAGGNNITGAVNLTSTTATIGGTNTIGGAVNINSGALLNFASPASLGSGNAINIAGGTLQFATGNNADVSATHPLNFNGSGAIDTNGNNVAIAGTLGGTGNGFITKTGTGDLTLTGGAAFSANPTNLFVRFGSLTLSGASEILTTTGYDSVGQNSGDRGTLNVANGAKFTTSNDFNLGDSASGTLAAVDGGIVNLSGTGSSLTVQQLFVGKGTSTSAQYGYGVINQSGGTLTSANNSQIGAFGFGQYNLSGGVWNHTGGYTSVARQNNSFGVIDVNGGTFNDSSALTRTIIGEQGIGILNVRNGGVLNDSTNGNNSGGNLTTALAALTLGNTAGATGIANLLPGGTISTTSVGSLGTGVTSLFNFNGGTLASRSTTTTFMQNLTAAYVYGGGALIDTTAGDATITQPLLAPTGAGVGSITLAGSGIATTPFVQITGGGGVGATAVATVDGSGNLTGFTITNPGTGYTSAPTVTVTGPFGTQVVGTATLNAGNVSGGLTKLGTGTLTLAATETYTGDTTISAGTLQLGNGTVNGVIASANVFDSGTLAISPGTAQTFNIPISGTGGFTKLGAGTLTLTSTNSYTGVTTVGGGILSVADLENGGVNSSIGASSAAPGNLVFAGGTLMYTGPSVTLDRGYTDGAGGGTLDIANNVTFAGQILGTGSGAFNKAGVGTLAYTNTASTNVLTGSGNTGLAYVVNNGLVQLGGTSAAPLAQTNVINGELTVGTINNATSPNAALEINGGTTTVASYIGAGRGNGTNNAATSITFNNNAVVTSGNFSIGYNNGVSGYTSSPTVTLNNTSSYTDSGIFRIGESVNGTGGVSTFNVNGSANFAQTGATAAATIGQSALGVFNQNGGTVSFAAPVQFGTSATGNGTYNLNAGTLSVASINKGTGTGALNFNGGTLVATATDNPGTATTNTTFLTGVTANVSNAGATVDTGAFTVTASSAFVPAGGTSMGGLTKLGSGQLNLTANNTYTGATAINNGTLNIDNGSTTPLTTAGNLSATASITVNNGGTLLLSGINTFANRINDAASVTVQSGGTFNLNNLTEGTSAAGQTAGGIGALTLAGGSTFNFGAGITGATLLATSGAVTGTGTISILNFTGANGGDDGTATNDRLLFVNDPAFSTTDLARFQFSDDTGTPIGMGATEISYNGYTELVPVPEPATWLAGALTVGLLGFSQRRRVSTWLGLARVA